MQGVDSRLRGNDKKGEVGTVKRKQASRKGAARKEEGEFSLLTKYSIVVEQNVTFYTIREVKFAGRRSPVGLGPAGCLLMLKLLDRETFCSGVISS
ncbi:MAG: hypothetical protein GXO71_05935 [Caldiserica bacterium]|nr:hypothetical protein [Caldisericota bacterium]